MSEAQWVKNDRIRGRIIDPHGKADYLDNVKTDKPVLIAAMMISEAVFHAADCIVRAIEDSRR